MGPYRYAEVFVEEARHGSIPQRPSQEIPVLWFALVGLLDAGWEPWESRAEIFREDLNNRDKATCLTLLRDGTAHVSSFSKVQAYGSGVHAGWCWISSQKSIFVSFSLFLQLMSHLLELFHGYLLLFSSCLCGNVYTIGRFMTINLLSYSTVSLRDAMQIEGIITKQNKTKWKLLDSSIKLYILLQGVTLKDPSHPILFLLPPPLQLCSSLSSNYIFCKAL